MPGLGSGCELAEFNGQPGYVHLLVNFPPAVAISRLDGRLKDGSSLRPRQELPDMRQHYWHAKRLGSGSYSAGSARRARPRSCASISNGRTGPPDAD